MVLGALALCVAMLAVYVLATNTVKQKQADLEEVTAQAQAASAETAKLKPYADFDAMAKTRVETVRGLAAARFDWEQAFRDLSRSVPSDVKLQSLSGDMGLPGTTGGGRPIRCAARSPRRRSPSPAARTSQPAVARMMARLRARRRRDPRRPLQVRVLSEPGLGDGQHADLQRQESAELLRGRLLRALRRWRTWRPPRRTRRPRRRCRSRRPSAALRERRHGGLRPVGDSVGRS